MVTKKDKALFKEWVERGKAALARRCAQRNKIKQALLKNED
ncbi:hypothetical protein [Dichelobacter nodosus]|nr:hypothetical protein [Dichelobacter nodosus]